MHTMQALTLSYISGPCVWPLFNLSLSLFLFMCMYMCLYAHICGYAQGPEEGYWITWN